MNFIQKGIDKTAYVSLFGALVENIIYGIAIGAGYHRSVGCGVAIGISLLAECIPHKITDFKLLTGVGLSKKVKNLRNNYSRCTLVVGFSVKYHSCPFFFLRKQFG